MSSSRVLTVTQVNTYIKSILEGDRNLSRVMVRGEISNFKNHYPSGHFYFTLKDSQSSIRAVMFKTHASAVPFMPENGMSVVVGGEISVYEREGQYQVYCTDILPEGIGSLALAFEQLKSRLGAEGLFVDEHKKALPLMPRRIAVITSKTGAAVQDILSILSRRYPIAEVLLCPVTVQGVDAPRSIISALRRVNGLADIDIIILARGGGSYEDLFCFNDEGIARAIYESATPVISAIGHETDYTIVDFVADLRAPTPSAAAELAVPELAELQNRLSACQRQLQVSCMKQLNRSVERLNVLSAALTAASPAVRLEQHQKALRQRMERLNAAMQKRMTAYNNRTSAYIGLLDALSPLKVLQRGYAVAYKDKSVIKSAAAVQAGEKITVRLQDGSFDAEVI